MDEQTLLTFLGRLIRQSIAEVVPTWPNDSVDGLADRLADTAWNGLIVLMRQMLISQGSITLDEVGSFKREEEQWVFSPAASLVEAEALRHSSKEGEAELIARGLFYLREGLKLVQALPRDARIKSSKVTPEDKLLSAIFGEKADRTVSMELNEIGKRLTRVSSAFRRTSMLSDEDVNGEPEMKIETRRKKPRRSEPESGAESV